MEDNKCIYSVYAYAFKDGMTYIGLTKNVRNRIRCHCIKTNSSMTKVMRYCLESGLPHPEMEILETNLNKREGQWLEGAYINMIEARFRLNKNPAGIGRSSTGYSPIREFTDEEVKERRIEGNWIYREEYLKRRKEEYLRHREENCRRSRQYRIDHPEKVKEREKKYRELHKKERSEQNKRWRDLHKEELILQRKEKWRLKKLEMMK